MLELTEEENIALQIVVLVCKMEKEVYGASHHLNWKKIGLSRAYYKQRIEERSMPTRRATAAYRFLMQNNK